MIHYRVMIQSDALGLRRRICTRVLTSPWPFLYSADPDGPGLVMNLPPWALEEPSETSKEAPRRGKPWRKRWPRAKKDAKSPRILIRGA